MKNSFFIVGTHRSGSTLFKNMLNQNSRLVMLSDEPDISDPWHFTFLDHLKKIGNLNDDKNILILINLIKSGKIYGTFWKEFAQIEDFNFDNLHKRFLESDRTHKSIFTIIMEEYRDYYKKEFVGAKYPVHPKHLELLLDWYPNAKYVFLIRDIYASSTSKINDKATKRRKKKALFLSPIVHFLTLIWFLIDFNWAAKSYQKNKHQDNIKLLKYEILVLHPQDTIKSICDFLDINFEEAMLSAAGKPSSYTGEIKYGIDLERLNKWKEKISRFDKSLISIFTKKSRKVFGYE